MDNTQLNSAAAQAEITASIKAQWEQIQKNNPQLSGLKIKVSMHTYKPRPAGYHRVYTAIVDKLLYRKNAERTQADILSELQSQYTEYKILPNLWNKPLRRKQLEKMQKQIDNSSFSGVKLSGCKTLAEIKKRIRASLHKGEAPQSCNRSIAIDATAVVIGKKTYPIITRSTGKYPYAAIRLVVGQKRQWVRVDALAALLEK